MNKEIEDTQKYFLFQFTFEKLNLFQHNFWKKTLRIEIKKISFQKLWFNLIYVSSRI